MAQIGETFWSAVWAVVGFLESCITWLQEVLGNLYTLACELFKIKITLRLASNAIMIPIALVIVLGGILLGMLSKWKQRRRRKQCTRQ